MYSQQERHAVPLTSVNGYDYTLKIEGRADGIIADISEDEDGNKISYNPPRYEYTSW